jgi:hypothetical protein
MSSSPQTPGTPAAQFVEEPANYIFNITLSANQVLTRVPVNIDRDSDFLWTGLNGSRTGAYSLNSRLPSGRQIGSANVNDTNLVGTANQPTAIGPPPLYRAGSTGPELDLTDLSGAPNTIQLVFSGIRRLRTA